MTKTIDVIVLVIPNFLKLCEILRDADNLDNKIENQIERWEGREVGAAK